MKIHKSVKKRLQKLCTNWPKSFYIFRGRCLNLSKTTGNSRTTTKIHKPISPEARENQIIAEAMDAVEKRILNGTATSQELIHFLRLGSEKSKLEKEKLRKENELLKAKTENLELQKRSEELSEKVIQAMKEYSGVELEYEDD